MDTTPSSSSGRAPPIRLADDVRALPAAGNDPELGAELFERLRESLRPLLTEELRQRILWHIPPRFFGVFRGDSWDDEEVLDELIADAYTYVFVERQAGLRRRAALGDDLGPVVERQVRDFLVDVQRRYNPLGSLLYGLLHRAVARLLEIRRFEIVEGDEHLRHDTVLVAPHSGEYGRDVSVELQPSVAAIVDALLPDLIASWGRDQVVDELTERLSYLPTDGVLAFRFGELVGRMVHEVRRRWRARMDGAPPAAPDSGWKDSGDGELVALAGLADDVMRREDVQRFLDRVENGIDQLSRSQRTRDELRRLWLFLRSWRSEGGGLPPSDQAIGRVLSIPDQRIPRLKATLGKQVLLSSRGLAAASPVGLGERHAALQARTLEAARRPGERPAADGPPRPGETFLFVPGDGDGIEWLVLAGDAEDERRHLVVPLDDFPLVGSHDAPLSGEDEGKGFSRLRCAHGVWIDRSAFTAERRSGEVSEGTVAMARHRRRQMAAGFLARSPSEPYPGTMTATAVERAADADPEYRIWTAELAIARQRLAERFGLPPSRPVRRWDLRLLAAALLGALLMAAALVFRLC